MRILASCYLPRADARHLSVALYLESGNTLARQLASPDLPAILTGCLSDDAFLIVLFRTGALGSGRIEMTGVRPLLIYNLLPNNHSSYYQHARTRMLGTTIKNTGKRCRTLTTSVAPRANTFEARTLRNSSHLSPYIDMAKSRLFGNAIGYTKLIANEINSHFTEYISSYIPTCTAEVRVHILFPHSCRHLEAMKHE